MPGVAWGAQRQTAELEASPDTDVRDATVLSRESTPRGAKALQNWRRAGARLRPEPHVTAGLIVFCVLLAAMALRNRFVFTHVIYEDGDFAANGVLIDRARHFGLLIGNYSRVGFFHPGPALLYVQAWGQLIFHDLFHVVPSALGAEILSIFVLNAALVGISAAVLVRRTQTRLAALAIVVPVLAITTLQPGLLSTTWMPDVYVWPFLLLLVVAASVGTGEARDLPLLAFATALLVHGHVSFVMIAGAIFAVALVGLVVSHRRIDTALPTRRTWLATGIVVLVFMVPIVLNTILHWPGEFDDYLRYSGSGPAGSQSLLDSIRFVRDYWAVGRPGVVLPVALVVAVVAIAVALDVAPSVRRYILGLVAASLVATGITVFYAWRGVDDLQLRYVAYFYYAAQCVLLAAVLLGLALVVRKRSWQVVAVVGMVVTGLFLATTGSGLSSQNPQVTWPPAAFAALPQSAQPLVLRFDANGWPPAGALLQYAHRHGRDVCVEDPRWALLYTTSLVCTKDELSRADLVLVQVPGTPGGGSVFYSDANVVVRRPS